MHNSFGRFFKIATWGESHGPAIGVIIDGCPPGLSIESSFIQAALDRRRPGRSVCSLRQESDIVEVLSGVYQGKSTGAPISLLIRNQDARPQDYLMMDQVLRPGHANYTYLKKYGHFDPRGGGRASARETACRVAAGAIAQLLLREAGIELCGWIEQIGEIVAPMPAVSLQELREIVWQDPLFAPDAQASFEMAALIAQCREEKDSVGGIVALTTSRLPIGLGDPVYEKLEANLAKAMLSIPASKGFEIGLGFASASMRGSEHNDLFVADEKGGVALASNRAGGTLGGISTGETLFLRVPFKPTASIATPQATTTEEGKSCTLTLKGRHDPCVAIRAVPVVEAMCALVLADALIACKAFSI